MNNKTEQWVVFTAHEEGLNLQGNMAFDVAVPVSWLAKGATMELRPTTEAEAMDGTEADFVVGPGEVASCASIDDVQAWVNVVYTLVDEGYLDGDKAMLAFKEAKPDGPANLNKWEAANTCPGCKGPDGEVSCLEDDNYSGTGWMSMRCDVCDCEWTIDYETAVTGITVTTKEVPSE
tara:strand:- start:1702 stop:2232 length:531 start_codon:yes stop_codon:yes gene_type:complete